MLVFGSVSVVLALILMVKHENNVRFISDDVQNAKTRDVWEYVSDFSNMMKLNPTMWVYWQIYCACCSLQIIGYANTAYYTANS